MQTATEFIKEELNKLGLLDKGQVMTNIFEQAKQIEYNQRGYTKKDVLKAGEIGEINHHDYKHIVKLLDEARQINETYESKESDEEKTNSQRFDEFMQLVTSSQTEISDEEIYKQADKEFRHFEDEDKDIWIRACQWYREQLKKKS